MDSSRILCRIIVGKMYICWTWGGGAVKQEARIISDSQKPRGAHEENDSELTQNESNFRRRESCVELQIAAD